jgi:hypothetical protein
MPTRNTTGNEDFQYVKCTNCGFPCKLGRDKIKIMEIIRDLAGGGKPSPINVFYQFRR